MARLLPPESSAIDVVPREVGISVATLESWRGDACSTCNSCSYFRYAPKRRENECQP